MPKRKTEEYSSVEAKYHIIKRVKGIRQAFHVRQYQDGVIAKRRKSWLTMKALLCRPRGRGFELRSTKRLTWLYLHGLKKKEQSIFL